MLEVKIEVKYSEKSERPSKFIINYKIDGVGPDPIKLPNKRR